MVRLGMQPSARDRPPAIFDRAVVACDITVAAALGDLRRSRYSLVRLAKIVTAFTLGHSCTLLVGALRWLNCRNNRSKC